VGKASSGAVARSCLLICGQVVSAPRVVPLTRFTLTFIWSRPSSTITDVRISLADFGLSNDFHANPICDVSSGTNGQVEMSLCSLDEMSVLSFEGATCSLPFKPFRSCR